MTGINEKAPPVGAFFVLVGPRQPHDQRPVIGSDVWSYATLDHAPARAVKHIVDRYCENATSDVFTEPRRPRPLPGRAIQQAGGTSEVPIGRRPRRGIEVARDEHRRIAADARGDVLHLLVAPGAALCTNRREGMRQSLATKGVPS